MNDIIGEKCCEMTLTQVEMDSLEKSLELTLRANTGFIRHLNIVTDVANQVFTNLLERCYTAQLRQEKPYILNIFSIHDAPLELILVAASLSQTSDLASLSGYTVDPRSTSTHSNAVDANTTTDTDAGVVFPDSYCELSTEELVVLPNILAKVKQNLPKEMLDDVCLLEK